MDTSGAGRWSSNLRWRDPADLGHRVQAVLERTEAAHRRSAARLRYIRPLQLLADQVLEKVLSLARADRGNVQLADPASGALSIIA